MPPSKRMQAARDKAIWHGHSMLTRVHKVPLAGRRVVASVVLVQDGGKT